MQDNSVDLDAYLSRAAARAINNGAGVHFITGAGTGKPRGVVTAATVGKTGATAVAGVPTADELIDLFFGVLPEYRSRGSWTMNGATLAKVRKLKDLDGRYFMDVSGGLGSGAPATLLGRPVVIDPNVASTGINAKSVVFGDFSAYAIREAGALRVEAGTSWSTGRSNTTSVPRRRDTRTSTPRTAISGEADALGSGRRPGGRCGCRVGHQTKGPEDGAFDSGSP